MDALQMNWKQAMKRIAWNLLNGWLHDSLEYIPLDTATLQNTVDGDIYQTVNLQFDRCVFFGDFEY